LRLEDKNSGKIDPPNRSICSYIKQIVGWVECNETPQSLELAQPNLRNAERPGIKPFFAFEVSYERKVDDWRWRTGNG
jgi:hypothetical protein